MEAAANLTMEELFEAAKTGNAKFLDTIRDPRTLAARDPHGDTACHVALLRGHLEFASKMASLHPPILNQPNAEGNTVLHCALRTGQSEFFVGCMKRLRYYLRDYINHTTFFPGNPDFLAEEAMNCRRALRNKEGKCLAYLAAENGDVEAVRILMETPLMSRTKGPNGCKALHAAVRERKYDVIQVLLQYKPELSEHLDKNGHAPLHLAVMLNDPEMIDLLIKGSQPESANILSKDGFSPLHLAATMNHLEIFERLLRLSPECCRETTLQGQNVLHLAVKERVSAIVEFIVNDMKLSGLMINQQDNDGNTPLHIAATNDDEEMLKTLRASQVMVMPLKNKEGLAFGDISKAHKERKLKEKTEKMQSRMMKAMEDFHSSLLVMATLITTVTFTAAFTLPGGYKSDGPQQGMATLTGRTAFKAFLASDTISLCSSIIATAALILFSVIFSTQKKYSILKVAIGSIAISMVFMLAAFAAGVWVVIRPDCRWLAILVVVATSCTPLVLFLVLGHIMLTFGNEDED